jgi:hypothetical protein
MNALLLVFSPLIHTMESMHFDGFSIHGREVMTGTVPCGTVQQGM